MNILSVRYLGAQPQTDVAIAMDDGFVWTTDAALAVDCEIRRILHAWLNAGGVPEPYVAPARVPVRTLSVLQFRDRLTAEEELAITAAGMASPAVRVWLDRLSGAQEVNLDDPRTVAGLHTMAAAGLLAAERVTEILA